MLQQALGGWWYQVAVGLYVFAGNLDLTSGITILTTAMRGLTTFLLFLLVSVVSAVDVHGSVEFNKVCPGPHYKSSSLNETYYLTIHFDIHSDIKSLKPTRVTLDWGTYSAHVWRDGRFVLRNVEPGSYVLNVLARDHVFDQLRVDIVPKEKPEAKADTPQTATGVTSAAPSVTAGPLAPLATSISDPNFHIRIYPLPLGTPHYPTPSLPQLSYPIVLKPRSAKVYVEPKKDFNPIDMFRNNPMMLLMLGSVAMMFFTPKIIASMDPKDRDDFLAQQSKMMAMPSQISQGISGLAEGRSSTPASQQPSRTAAMSSSNSQATSSPRKKKGAKR
ncbi:hypothetical protein FRC01_006421 [Tulasnella sp. 417]|nr:hypothetical protein FRC01_006421 [Tulasnella sp. 417]